MADRETTLTELTATVVGAFVGNNSVSVTDLPALIKATYGALAGVGEALPVAGDEFEKPTAGAIRKSIGREGIRSFIDGKEYRTLRRHLTTHGLTVEEYKARYGLPRDYPVVAPAYSEARSKLAKALGLGQGGRGGKGKAAAAPAPAPKAKAKPKKA